ncbi:hypothetical protein EXIGLDRAFT_829257 [Exidia glandulosa HHB12029]|uniref:CFEM domain-containing protein n=1 Tax=Exidia glandulosa HHB12029 TaxID=1314781 RepID=A0A165PLY8_EXIGL|nr:hypothetical protein EXIGLDRAFT_829257 [Exidia glandulosa HHB12029]
MRASISFILALSALSVSVLAQDGDSGGLSADQQCLLNCGLEGLKTTTCTPGEDDYLPCICSSTTYSPAVDACLDRTCAANNLKDIAHAGLKEQCDTVATGPSSHASSTGTPTGSTASSAGSSTPSGTTTGTTTAGGSPEPSQSEGGGAGAAIAVNGAIAAVVAALLSFIHT